MSVSNSSNISSLLIFLNPVAASSQAYCSPLALMDPPPSSVPELRFLGEDLLPADHYAPSMALASSSASTSLISSTAAANISERTVQSVLDELVVPVATSLQNHLLDNSAQQPEKPYDFDASSALKDYQEDLHFAPVSPLVPRNINIDPLATSSFFEQFPDDVQRNRRFGEDAPLLDLSLLTYSNGCTDDVATTATIKSFRASTSLDSLFGPESFETVTTDRISDIDRTSSAQNAPVPIQPESEHNSAQLDLQMSPVTPPVAHAPHLHPNVSPNGCMSQPFSKPLSDSISQAALESFSNNNALSCSSMVDAPRSASSVSNAHQAQLPSTEATSQHHSDSNYQQGDVPARRYKIMQPSKFCHICVRSGELVTLAPCANVITGVCRKAICAKCFDKHGHGLEWDQATQNHALLAKEQAALAARGAVLSQVRLPASAWACFHCRNICPDSAQCKIYARTNKRRHMLLKQRKAEKARHCAERLAMSRVQRHDSRQKPCSSIMKSPHSLSTRLETRNKCTDRSAVMPIPSQSFNAISSSLEQKTTFSQSHQSKPSVQLYQHAETPPYNAVVQSYSQENVQLPDSIRQTVPQQQTDFQQYVGTHDVLQPDWHQQGADCKKRMSVSRRLF